MKTDTMKTENVNLFVINLIVIGAVILAFALFGCSSGKSSNTTASGTIDGAALYSSDCSGCHGSLATSGKKGASISQIQNAIAHNMGGMGAYRSLTADQLQAIVSALTAVGTTNPTTTNAIILPPLNSLARRGRALFGQLRFVPRSACRKRQGRRNGIRYPGRHCKQQRRNESVLEPYDSPASGHCGCVSSSACTNTHSLLQH